MTKEYTIQEVFNFPVGTILKDKDGLEIKITDLEGGYKGLIALWLVNNNELELTSAWINSKFTLKKVPLTFFEAMAKVDVGNIVTSNDEWSYKKINGKLLGTSKILDYKYDKVQISSDEISGEWYEEVE